jgi:hypothetical protein
LDMSMGLRDAMMDRLYVNIHENTYSIAFNSSAKKFSNFLAEIVFYIYLFTPFRIENAQCNVAFH